MFQRRGRGGGGGKYLPDTEDFTQFYAFTQDSREPQKVAKSGDLPNLETYSSRVVGAKV